VLAFTAWLFARLSLSAKRHSFVAAAAAIWTRRPKAAAALVVGLSATLMLVGGVTRLARRREERNLLQLPAYVRLIESEAVDLRLNWTASGVAMPDRALINPTLLWLPSASGIDGAGVEAASGVTFPVSTWADRAWADQTGINAGRLVVAARLHRTDEFRGDGTWRDEEGTLQRVTEVTTQWTSEMVLSSVPFSQTDLDGWNAAEWGLENAGANMTTAAIAPSLDTSGPGSVWSDLCEPTPRYNPSNATVMRKNISGAEDPKLIPLPAGSIHGKWTLAFSSHPPKLLTGSNCSGSPYGVSQMYIAANGEAAVRAPVSPPVAATTAAVASRIQCGYTRRDEKNWMGFVHEGQLHFVYSVHPHSVVLVRAADGACTSRWSTSTAAPLFDLAATNKVDLHGSASAVLYGDRYLALFHTRDVSSGNYTTFAYSFEARPPFTIKAVSRPLPLLGGGRAFASGLAILPAADKIVVTYGFADVEARAFIMSLRHFDSTMWDWCLYNRTKVEEDE